MALVRFGSIVSTASGALGGLCFSRQGGAPIVRSRPTVKPSTSQAALAHQALIARAHAAWRALTDDEQLTWIRLAEQLPETNRLGLSRPLPGRLLFMRCALRRLSVDLIPVDTPMTMFVDRLTKTVQLTLWPGGPAELLITGTQDNRLPYVAVRAQRLHSTHPGCPGQLWKNVPQPWAGYFTTNFWPQLAALFDTPTRLEWFRFELTKWVTGWPREIVSRHLLQIPNVGDDLIYNGDFELYAIPPPGWAVIGTGQLIRSSETPYGDRWCGHWMVAAGQAATFFCTHPDYRFSVTGAQAYTFRIAYKIASGSLNYIQLWSVATGFIWLCGTLTYTDGTWLTYTYHFTPPTSGSNVAIYFNSLDVTPCDIYFDNLSLRKDVY